MRSDFLYKAIFKFVQSLSETFLIIKRIQRQIIINADIPVKYALFLPEFKETWIFSQNFEEYSNINFNEKLKWQLTFHIRKDRQTD
jgi:hypothetical protein